MAAAGTAGVVAGLLLLAAADNAYATHVTGVYLDRCGAGEYSASAGPDQAIACYPYALVWLYWCAGAGAALVVLGFGLLCQQSISRLRTAGGWELGLRALLHLLAAPAFALAAFEVNFRGVAQSVWRSGCWICPAPVPPTAPDPYPVFDVATIALVAAGSLSAAIALAIFGAASSAWPAGYAPCSHLRGWAPTVRSRVTVCAGAGR